MYCNHGNHCCGNFVFGGIGIGRMNGGCGRNSCCCENNRGYENDCCCERDCDYESDCGCENNCSYENDCCRERGCDYESDCCCDNDCGENRRGRRYGCD